MGHWLIEALQTGLEHVDTPDLIELAAKHVQVEDPFRGERAIKRISPSLIAEECRLSRLKRYRKHGAQPGVTRGAFRQGRPSAGSNMHFFRGHYAEGMAVAALARTAESYQTYEGEKQTTHQGLGLYPFHVVGLSPWAVFECDALVNDGPVQTMTEVSPGKFMLMDWTAHFLAYPDVIMLQGAEPELIQMKCPSVWAFARYNREGTDSIRRRYEPQAIAEMYIARLMGLPVVRNHILVFALEGALPGSESAKAGQEVLALVHTVEWSDEMEAYIESIAREILEDDLAAEGGEWPVAYPYDTKWPCNYCSYPRNPEPGQAGCEEQDKWEPKALTSGTSQDGRQTAPPPLPESTETIESNPTTTPPPLPVPTASGTTLEDSARPTTSLQDSEKAPKISQPPPLPTSFQPALPPPLPAK